MAFTLSSTSYCALFLCVLLCLVNDAETYGDPDHFHLAHNANGGAYRRGYALDWMVRSQIITLFTLGMSTRAIASHYLIKRSKSGVQKIVNKFLGGDATQPPE